MADRAVEQQADVVVAMLAPVIREAKTKARQQAVDRLMAVMEEEIGLIRREGEEGGGLAILETGWSDRLLRAVQIEAETIKRGQQR